MLGALLALVAAPGTGCDEDRPVCRSVRAEACDIREASCQENSFCLVRSIYGEDRDAPPEVRIISEAQFRSEITASAAPEDERSSHLSAVLELLGLVGPGVDASEAELESTVKNTVAYYAHKSQDVTVIDHGQAADPTADVYVLCHEFVHALQDARFDLTRFYDAHSATSDNFFAAQSLVEGEATLYADRTLLQIEAISPYSFDWSRVYDEQFAALMEFVGASAAPFSDVGMAAPYVLGGEYATELWLDRGDRGVRDLWSDPPAAMLDWMNGYGAEPVPAAPAGDAPAAPDPPDRRFEDVFTDRFGALGLFALLVGRGDDPAEAWTGAREWRYDRLWTFADFSDGRNAAVWLIGWSGEEAAAAFAAGAGDQGWKIWTDGNETAILASDDAAALADWSYPPAGPAPMPRRERLFTAPPRPVKTVAGGIGCVL